MLPARIRTHPSFFCPSAHRNDALIPCLAIETFQTLGGFVRAGEVASQIPFDSGLLMPTLNRFSDYDNDNDNDRDAKGAY